jgi:eukaryotic-like serine/threonine-protein kinase
MTGTDPLGETLPERIGGYVVLGLLGTGAFSRVYRVSREGGRGFRKELALKLLAPGSESAPDLRRMFIDEGALVCHLHHRNIVAVHEVGYDGESPFLVMELVDGLDLRTLLRRLRGRRAWLPLPSAVDVVAQLLHGLHHAHNRRLPDGGELGIVHRDLKPDNVMVSVAGCVKVTDFGLARTRAVGGTEDGITRGTARFMSPEQARGRPLDARSDVFSSGVLLYMMLTARLPFSGTTDLDVMRAVARAQFKPVQLGRTHIPNSLARVVHRMMAPSPDSRYRSALEAAEALADSVDGGWGGQPERVLGGLVRRAADDPAEDSTLEEGSTQGLPGRIERELLRRIQDKPVKA